jgi:acyl-CoA synthetase (AMP-forming)/AMP-acid ligase II/acyl carrier protein
MAHNFKTSQVETALLSTPFVEDCRVLMREIETNSQELVAYIILKEGFFPQQLQSHLQALLSAELLPSAYVALSNLPRLSTGEVDEQALSLLAVIDFNVMQKCETQLQALPSVEKAAVVVQPQFKSLPPLHLSDLVPNWNKLFEKNGKQDGAEDYSQEKSKDKLESNKLAISHGEPLQLDEIAPKTLVQALHHTILNRPTQEIIYIQSDRSQHTQSYKNLLLEAQQILAGLRKLGLKPQDKVIFQLERNQDFICAFWACVLGGFIPVPIAPAPVYSQDNSAIRKLENAWQMLGKPTVLTTANLAEAINYWSKELNLENFQLATLNELLFYEPDQNLYPCQPSDVALLVLTSGSTGMPKGVMLTHDNLLSRTAGSIQMNCFSSSDITFNWMPLDHVAGIIYFHIRDVYLGCQQIHAPTQLILQDPLMWLDYLEQYRATITFAPNFAFGLINNHAQEINQRHWDLSSVKFVLNGAESIVAKTAKRFMELLAPHHLRATAMYPAWGMAEVSSGVTYSYNFSRSIIEDDSFVEVGKPIPGVSLRIVNSNNQVVEENTIGSLQVSGKTVMSGYYNNTDLNREVFTKDGWFITGDLGFLSQGCLTITGREKDVIIINGANYYSHEIESAVEEVEGVEVSFTAAVGVRGSFDHTDKLAIFFSPVVADEAELVQLTKEIRNRVVQNIGVNPDYLLPVDKEVIPKTSIGKIQRSQLKKSFEAGEFQDILKRLDILIANANTIPDWFYQKVWRTKQATLLNPLSQTNLTVVFLDELGLGKFVCQQLEQQNLPYVCVSLGSDFAQLSPNHYCIAPVNAEHYQRLFSTIKANKVEITQILHLWNYQEYNGEINNLKALEEAQNLGIYSLLFLVQALTKVQSSEDSVRLLFISSYTQAIKTTDKVAYEKSPVLGIVKTIPQEIPWLNCRHIDLQPNQLEKNGSYILQELQVLSKEAEIAYRDGQRFVSILEKVDLQNKPKQEFAFKLGGMYLITGGLGGVGVEIAKYLIKSLNAKLLLVGRTPIQEISTKLQAYHELKQLGDAVVYEAVNISDLSKLQQVVAQVKSRWGCELDGVIHLAGIYHEHLLIDETQESLAAMLRPKVFGTWVLHQLLVNEGGGVFISFSSLMSFFGGATIGSYTAANNFLESFNQYQRSVNLLRSYCFAWTIWREIGINKGYQRQDLTRAQGYYDMNPQQGIYSLLAGLYYDQSPLIVGLDASNPKIRRFSGESGQTEKLTAYFTTSNGSQVDELSELIVRDRFGTTVNCDLVQIPEMPLTSNGEIDRNLLVKGKTGLETTDDVAPRNETELQIAQIWQEVLKISHLSIHDNFFSLGGNSLLAFQVISRLRDAFSIELSLNRFFASPTVASLGKALETLRIVAQEWTVVDDAEDKSEEGVI